MGIYKNDYDKKEDYMMYELHEIRNELSKEIKNVNQINKQADTIMKKYKLNNLKINKTGIQSSPDRVKRHPSSVRRKRIFY